MAEETEVVDDGIDNIADQLAGEVLGRDAQGADDHVEDSVDSAVDNVAQEPIQAEQAVIDDSPAPKSWPNEMHPHWSKTPREVREYWNTREKQMLDGLDQYKNEAAFGKQLRAVFAPYQQILRANNMDETRAAQTLMNAHYRLSTSPADQRKAYFMELAKQYQIDLGEGVQQSQLDPVAQQLQQRLSTLEQSLSQQAEQAQQLARERVSKEVEAFSADPKHPYFDEVAEDIVIFLGAGMSLEDSYQRAVWANPATREKESARLLQERMDAERAKSQEKVAAAKKATATNVRSLDTARTPTEKPKGKLRDLDDVMRETAKELSQQTH